MTSKASGILGKGKFSIFLPQRVDSEYYVKSPVKVKAEMFLFPEQLGVGGLHLRTIPCSARAQKLTQDNHFDIVNVPIKIEAEVLLSPGFHYSSKTSTPHNGEEMKTQCTVKIIEPNPILDEATEGWHMPKEKTRENVSNSKAPNYFKGDKKRGVLVHELKLNDNSKREKDLSRQLNSYVNQLLEQNKKINKFQEQLREEQSKGASSLEKVHIVEQQCKLLDQRLKAAECRARVAGNRAEAIKQRTKILSISCGHQGIQLKDLSRHLEFFAKNFNTKKVQVTYKKSLEQHKILQPRETLNANDATTCTTTLTEGSNLCPTIRGTKPSMRQSLSHEIETNVRENTPDLNSPSTKCFYQTITMQELNDKYVLFLCRRSLKDQQSLRVVSKQKEKPQPTTKVESIDPNSTRESMALPPQMAELLFNQYLQMPPNSPMEFDSSIQRIEELVKGCVVQAMKLKDLSKDLDCFPKKLRSSDHSTTSRSSTCTSTSTSNLKVNVNVVEGGLTPSPKSTPLSEVQGDHQALLSETKVAHQTNRCLERYVLNLKEAAETLVQKQKVQQIDEWIQTLPELPQVKLALDRCSENLQQPLKICFPHRYEVKAWRMAFQTLIQGLFLWLGLLLLPQVSFFQPHSLPPT